MNILQINNTDFQGTGYNGHDLQISLNEHGIIANDIVLYKKGQLDSTKSFVTKEELIWQHQFNEFEKKSGLLNCFEPFGGKIKHMEQFKQADIVHFQLIHNHVITVKEIATICKLKPCVWTVHDLWAVTGHCIHPLDCEGWKNGCIDCKKLEDPFFGLTYPKAHELWKLKESVYKEINPDIIVASDFTKHYIEQSPMMSHFSKIHKIPFGIKMNNCMFDSNEVKQEWGIPIENVVISFRLNKSKLKGVKYLVKALEKMQALNVTVVAVDSGDSSMMDSIRNKYQIIEMGQQDQEGMQKFYAMSDIFVMPSLAETFGLMAVEAMAHKCTVVVFDNTVLPEVTYAPECGVSVPFKDDKALGERLDSLVTAPQERMQRGELGFQLVCEHYKYDDYVKKHIQLYKEINENVTQEQRKIYIDNYQDMLEESEKMEKKMIGEKKRKQTMLDELNKLNGGEIKKICIFCAGIFSERAYEILRSNGVAVDVIADNNPDKWGKWNYGLSCISKEQLLRERESMFVVVANKNPKSIKDDLIAAGFKHVIDYYELEKVNENILTLYGQNSFDKIAELDYSDENTMELVEAINHKIEGLSLQYEKKIEELEKSKCAAKPVKAIAMYLPQFHETKENNEWWGEGFTEWTAVKKAQILYEGHYQPHIPQNNNYYNLLTKETMEWQAKIAKDADIYGFCFYHYWFKDGRRALEKPAENLLKWKDIDTHFCFSWANESWIRTWSNVKGGNAWVGDEKEEKKHEEGETGILLEQQYGTEKDWKEHFDYLLPFFKDERYIKKDGKPIFMIYRPELVDCMDAMLAYWKKLAKENGLPGVYILCANCEHNIWTEVDARYIQEFNYSYSIDSQSIGHAVSWDKGILTYDYDVLWDKILDRQYSVDEDVYLGGCVNFDCTPRHGKKGNLSIGGTPEKFENYFQKLCERSIRRNNDFVFINAWNEWGEGMHLEPDEKYGNAFLDATKSALERANQNYRALSMQYDIKQKPSKFENSGSTAVSIEEYNFVRKKQRKFVEYFNLFDKWFDLKEANRGIDELLIEHGYANVAIYGMGTVGKHLLHELKNSKVNVKYAIDRKSAGQIECDVPICDISNELEDVDIIIVSAVFDFDNIKSELEKRFSGTIISFDKVLDWK